MDRSEWVARFLRCYLETIGLLERIQAETGYGYKDITAVDLADYKNCPVWCDGRLEIGYNNDPESLAHELGHGLHEKIREAGKSDFLGEEFAEAIRYYVESEMDTNSDWLHTFDKGQNRFTKCYELDDFVRALKSGDLFNALDWT